MRSSAKDGVLNVIRFLESGFAIMELTSWLDVRYIAVHLQAFWGV